MIPRIRVVISVDTGILRLHIIIYPMKVLFYVASVGETRDAGMK
jgi:hypothetical protein